MQCPSSPLVRLIGLSAVILLLTACEQSGGGSELSGDLEIRTLSNRADLLSGGDALLEIVPPDGAGAENLTVEVNDRDVSDAFAVRPNGRVQGKLEGLREGENSVTARLGGLGADLTLTNHDRGGPVFSGPQVEPWVCATPEAREGDADTPATVASGLSSEAVDDKCNIPAEVSYYYRTTDDCGRDPENPVRSEPCFKDYDLEGGTPDDLATTTDLNGEEIPYIVRVERGTLNRGIYDIAVRHIPGEEWSPVQSSATWNGKLVHTFGGSTGTPRRQMPPNSSWQDDEALSRGFMVSVSSMTDQALNANKVVAAETLMMLKEHIGDNYGEIRHTIGSGCSGGSIMQLVISGTYPGLLDGIQPSCTYPDSHSTRMEVTDCVLLGNYFDSDEFAMLTDDMSEEQVEARKSAIAGHKNAKACAAWSRSFGHSNNPGNFQRDGETVNNCMLPEEWVYDPETNPDGVRCSQPAHEVALWGTAPDADHARWSMDNVGVQYGLEALEEGVIEAEEFVTLNENIGGSHIEDGLTQERMEASEAAVSLIYRAGMVTDPRQWAKVPMIDLRGNDNSGIHMNWRPFAVRDRLDQALGHHDNQVIWRFGPGLLPPAGSGLSADSLETMDAWISAIKADDSGRSLEEKVVANRPDSAYDFCLIDDNLDTRVRDWERCNDDPVLTYYESPRQVAGGPLAENVLKCELKPLARDDYSVTFTDEQWDRLQSTFSQGVCDWDQPGVGMQPAVPWLDYGQGPGGEPLPPAPRSRAL